MILVFLVNCFQETQQHVLQAFSISACFLAYSKSSVAIGENIHFGIVSTDIQIDLTSDVYCGADLCFLWIRKEESSKKVVIILKFLQLFFWQYLKITILNKVSKNVYELIHSQVPQLTCFGIKQ